MENIAMNRNWLIIILIIFPTIVFSQKINEKELLPFADIKNGNYLSAIDSLKTIISVNPKPEFYLTIAEAYFELGNYDKALEYCNKLEKIKQFYSSKLKFKIYLWNNKQENAKKFLIENLKSDYKISLYDLLHHTDFSGIYNMELDNFILTGNYYSQTEKQLYQVDRLIEDEKHTQALFIVNEIITRNSSIAQALYLQSKIYYFEKDFQGALKSINSSVELKRSSSEYLKHRIEINRMLNEIDEALVDINKLIKLESYNIDNYIIKADLLFKTNQFDKAIELTNSTLKILPEDPDVLYLSSKSYFMKKDHLEALKAINQALQKKLDKDFYELRGDIYSATNTYEFAIRDYAMYLDIVPYNGDIYAKKGFARLKLGDKKGACYDWEKGKRYGSYNANRYLEKYCR
ncbi:tetratricopeptide repeat protein [Bacteroidota bacterium]